jgi:hypothetical protein
MPIFEIDNTQATLLGFSEARWEDYRKELTERRVEVYTTTTRLLKKEDSIYWKSHGDDEIEKKSKNKKKDPQSVASAMDHVILLILDFKEPETRKAIVTYLGGILKIDEQELETKIGDIERSKEPNKEMMSYLLFETSVEDGNSLAGYHLLRALRGKLRTLLKGEDKGSTRELDEWIGYVDLQTKSKDHQQILAASKSMLVDTLQQNLKLLQEDKPLIPIHFVIASDVKNNSSTFFTPDWKRIINKEGFFLTNAEVRMAYKLMHEIGDQLITELMTKTVFFYQNTALGFKQVASPWHENPEDWSRRTRSQTRLAYKERDSNGLPQWIKELSILSIETMRILDGKERCSQMPGVN